MGYTQSWTTHKSLSLEDFTQLQVDFVTIKNFSQVDIVPETSCGWTNFFQHESEVKPYATKNMAICFNGIGEDGHETFGLRNHEDNGFCKTAQKPYDEVVGAVLLWAKYSHIDYIDVRTDGDRRDWQPAIDLIAMAMRVEIDIEIEDGKVFMTSMKDVKPSVVIEMYKQSKLAGAFS